MTGRTDSTARETRDVISLTERAARGAGFCETRSRSFARAAALHLQAGGDGTALARALRDCNDSPVIRLPLVVEDILRAAQAMPGPLELTLHPDDRELAPAYARLLPVRLVEVALVERPEAPPRLRVAADLRTRHAPDLPSHLSVPRDLVDRLTGLAARASAIQENGSAG